MRIPRALASSGLLLAVAHPASAAVMDVTYSITPEIVLLGTSIPSYDAGGQLTLRYTATSSVPPSATGGGFAAVPGPATLLGGSLHVTATYAYPPTGMAISAQRLGFRLAFGPGAGALSSPGGALLLPALRVAWTSTHHCYGLGYGPLCSPASSSVVYGASGTAPFGWSAPAHWTGSGLDPAALVGLTIPLDALVAIHLAGANEISRHFLPEPDDELSLTTAAAVVVALLARRRRRRALPSGTCDGPRSASRSASA